MPVHAVHHFNIRAPAAELRVLRDFYCDVIGLSEGFRPPFRSSGFWLYADGVAVLHLSAMSNGETLPDVSQRRSALDHVALRCSGLESILARLDGCGIAYSITEVPLVGQTQVFLKDPSGLGVELNFERVATSGTPSRCFS